MRTTVDLPDELMRKAKMRSAERGESLTEMFVRIVERDVSAHPVRGTAQRMQLPLLGGDKPGSVALSNQDIAEIIDRDDAEHLNL